MPNDFYDPMHEVAGPLAHEYSISISDVLSLLALAGKDRALVVQALRDSAASDEAQAAARERRTFGLVDQARRLLKQRLAERSASP